MPTKNITYKKGGHGWEERRDGPFGNPFAFGRRNGLGLAGREIVREERQEERHEEHEKLLDENYREELKNHRVQKKENKHYDKEKFNELTLPQLRKLRTLKDEGKILAHEIPFQNHGGECVWQQKTNGSFPSTFITSLQIPK